jgi:hypothetical protein
MQGGKNWILPKEINANRLLLRLSLAGNLAKPLMSLYGTEWVGAWLWTSKNMVSNRINTPHPLPVKQCTLTQGGGGGEPERSLEGKKLGRYCIQSSSL